jgi:hypothetical protein
MRSQVQVLAGPPHIPAGHSAVGSEPGAAAASLGRAGAARLSPSARPSALSGPPTRAAGSTTTTHRGRPPSTGRQLCGRRGHLAPPACSHALAPPATGAPHAGLACLVALRVRAATRTQPSPGRPPTSRLPNARPRQRRPQACSAVDRAARRRGRPQGPRPDPDGCPPHRPGRQRHHLTWDETDASGRTGADSRRLDAGRVDSRRPDLGRRPQVTGHRTAGQPDPGHPKPDGWTPHAGHRRPTPWRACWQCRPRRRRPTSRYWLDAPPRRRRLGEQPPGPLSRRHAEGTHAATDGSGHRRDRQLSVVRRRPAGALAHCSRVLDLDGTRGGQWDNGKVSGCGVRLASSANGMLSSFGWNAYAQVKGGVDAEGGKESARGSGCQDGIRERMAVSR